MAEGNANMGTERVRGGFTLLELLVAVAIFGIVMAGLFQSFTVQHKTSVVVDQVAEAQQNLRAVTDLLERDVRRAGYMVPPSAAVCGHDNTNAPDTLFLSNTDVIRPVAGLEAVDPDLVSGGMGVPLGVGFGWNAGGTNFLMNLPPGRLWVDVQADGPDFEAGAGVILVDRNDPNGRVACGFINWVLQGPPTQMEVNFGPSTYSALTASPDVVVIPAHVYTITAPAPGVPDRLMRDGLVLANDVEDLQVVYYFDLNGDRIEDPGEVIADDGTADYPPIAGTDMTTLVDLEVNLITVTRDDDPNETFTPMQGQATGNRTVVSLPGPDRKRRRVNTATVRLRNLG